MDGVYCISGGLKMYMYFKWQGIFGYVRKHYKGVRIGYGEIRWRRKFYFFASKNSLSEAMF